MVSYFCRPLVYSPVVSTDTRTTASLEIKNQHGGNGTILLSTPTRLFCFRSFPSSSCSFFPLKESASALTHTDVEQAGGLNLARRTLCPPPTHTPPHVYSGPIKTSQGSRGEEGRAICREERPLGAEEMRSDKAQQTDDVTGKESRW